MCDIFKICEVDIFSFNVVKVSQETRQQYVLDIPEISVKRFKNVIQPKKYFDPKLLIFFNQWDVI